MKKKRNKLISFVREHLIVSVIILVILLVILIFVGLEVYTFVRFVVGYDIIVRLNSNKKDLFLLNGQEEQVNFKIKSIASPLCSMQCSSIFLDISKNVTIAEEDFSVKQQEEKIKTYSLKAEGNGNGQDLYRFSVSCHNVPGIFCHTKSEPMTRTILLTLNRELNQEELELKTELKQKIEANVINFLIINGSLSSSNENLVALNNEVEVNDSKELLNSIIFFVSELQKDVLGIEELWKEQKYFDLKGNIDSFEEKVKILEKNFAELNNSVFENISFYNELIENLTTFKNELEILSKKQFNQSDVLRLEQIIKTFNKNVSVFEFERDINKKEKIANLIFGIDLSNYYNISYGNETLYFVNATAVFNLTKINFVEYNFTTSTFILNDPMPNCCVLGVCRDCCLNCRNENYPILFLHGHDFSEDISAEYSTNIFNKLQEKLDEEGYLNGGEIYSSYARSNVSRILGLTNVPLTFRGSYYFDSFKQSDGYIPVQMKSENIDSYAVRVSELIEEIKYETGKERVIIIAHSMGGLVARRYIQIFGSNNVDKLILIAVPNKGIEGKIEKYCSFFGANLECRDMDKDSLFINKLNNKPSAKIKTFNIIGQGCRMDEGDGDGIVLVKNAMLENADESYYIKGSCSGVYLLHGEILNIEKYTEVYKIIKEILNEQNGV